MENGFLSLFDVSISFEQSHLFFPRIITWVLVVMLGVILIKERRAILPGLRKAGEAVFTKGGSFDRLRFFGTIVLTTVYFYSMYVVGRQFPNTGYGFLLMSIPFIFLLSLLYVEKRTRKNIAIISVTAVIAPLLVWFLLARLFGITLP
ncbi:tripartite tricarboxylate transporter TctB family protein [Chromohalobacter sp. HP20-39]|uniref:tripartite tricarboxylate transporter TctB family protein n=1 Tax=Chromohalobacter sp. HP20-39 TaxID=3079306 RepID=UPI00294ABE9C|nr:tripartite tricarboxylate transporter TctB family protein [Chromohalobacter sp. HP20-39]MDV6317443.1 tripartite tricarboxylate transporter TctB family protein [Chromohalobacter sp. HP20-39]